MRKMKLFLASSEELSEDRKAFEVFVRRKNDRIVPTSYIELKMWEDFKNTMSKNGLQAEYDREVAECDLFVMLFFTKVGRFTLE